MNNETEQIFLVNPAETQSLESQNIIDATSSTVNLDDVDNFSKVCRICATTTEFVVPILSEEGLQNNLADKIHRHLSIQVSEQDQLPQVVCYQCTTTLLAWHELVKCCVQADAALKARAQVLREKLQKREEQTRKEKIEKDMSAAGHKFYNVTKKALYAYVHSSGLIEDDTRMVCQKCAERPSSVTVEGLAEHLAAAHGNEVGTEAATELFIGDYITFERHISDDDSASDDARADAAPNAGASETNVPNFSCPLCETAFTSTARLACHMNRHDDVNVDGGLVCCGIEHGDRRSLADHLKRSHVRRDPDAAHACRSCGHRARCGDELRAHVASAHGGDPPPPPPRRVAARRSSKNQKYIPAVCPECDVTFSNKYNMLVHMRGHFERTVRACAECGKTFSGGGNLRGHVRVAHRGVLRFLCPHCGEAFPTRMTRDVHARVHTGSRPYACEYCGKSFRAKNSLDRHVDAHLGVKRYECRVCGRRFSRSGHLRSHTGTHGRTD